jgi:hypothetical protein
MLKKMFDQILPLEAFIEVGPRAIIIIAFLRMIRPPQALCDQ